eukprot:COSAG02_NODE_2441_length_8858_cov_31.570271_3_plen_63_part_00
MLAVLHTPRNELPNGNTTRLSRQPSINRTMHAAGPRRLVAADIHSINGRLTSKIAFSRGITP